MKEKVVVGLSGGVDSSVAAHLLLEQGYDVIGVTMQIWQDERYSHMGKDFPGQAAAIEDARKIAETLGIPYYVLDFKDVFKREVVDYFVKEYLAGRTPNPCVVCNRRVKWEALLLRTAEFGANYVATGHYAQIHKLENGRFALHTSKGIKKDQTYALYNLTQSQLEHTIMPNGAYEKDEIRSIAEKNGIGVFDKPDSQEICFIPDKDYAGFIENHSDKKLSTGNFVDKDGNILGKHKGITHYTIGQRKGLGIAFGHPVFVSEIRTDTNEVVLGEQDDIFGTNLIADRVNWMAMAPTEIGKEHTFEAFGKIRYNQMASECLVYRSGEDEISVEFKNPQRAITKGQSVVLYDEAGYVIGGGTIK